MTYLSEIQLRNLKNHKYSCVDDSILYNYVLCHWWNFAIKFMPLWLAPNMITFLGTIGLLINSAIVWYYCPNLISEPSTPKWICLASAFFLFAYQTLDNLDGKQARRTKTSSQIGELVDHGCDSLVVTIVAVICCSLGSFGMGWPAVVFLIGSWALFWMSTWEQYHTGTLYLGYFNGPEEGLTTLIMAFLYTFFAGFAVWNYSFKDFFDITDPEIPDFEMKTGFAVFAGVPVVITAVYTFIKVLNHLKRNKKPVLPAIGQLMSFAIFGSCVVLWFHYSPEMWHEYPRTVQYTLGLAFGEMVSRLILAHMCEDEFDLIQRPMIPLLVVAGHILLTKVAGIPMPQELTQFHVVIGWMIATWASYYHLVSNVLHELSVFLKVKILTIPYPPKAE